MSTRGFTLVELLIAAALVLVITAAVVLLSSGMRRAFEGSLDTVDLTARARAGVAALSAEIVAAGTGVAIGPPLQRLAAVAAVVRPRRSLDDGSATAPFTAIALTRSTGSQGMLLSAASAGSVALALDPAAPSTRQDGTAGLQRGDTALVFDTARAEMVSIADASAWTITLQSGLRQSFAAGSYIAGIERATYGLRNAGGGHFRLVRRTVAGAEQPVVDHVLSFTITLAGVAEPPRPAAIPEWFPTYGPLAPPLGIDDDRDGWPAGENCTMTVGALGQREARLPQQGPAGSLMPITAAALADGPWCPDASDAERFDADLLRVARVDVRLTIAAAPTSSGTPVTPLDLTSVVALRER